MDLDKKEKAFGEVYLKILNFLSFKRRSESEILGKVENSLSKAHLPLREIDEVRQRVLSEIKKSGYLKDSHDLDFSLSYMEELVNSKKPVSKIKISQFLFKKGISQEIIQKALDTLSEEFIYDSVLKDAQKKLKLLKGEDKRSKKKKLVNFLYRKGYPFDVVTSVVDTLL